MSQPPDKYERIFDFTDFSAMQPSAQQPGQKIDQELNAARESLNETIDRLGEIQRDDGKLRASALDTTEFNGIVNAATATATAAASSASASASTATTKAGEATSAATTASGAATTATGAAASAQAQATIASTSATTANTKAAEAADSAASALTSKNSAFASASSATSSAGAAAGSAAEAATFAGNAANSANQAGAQANLAVAAAVEAENSANSFGLSVGTVTTGASGSPATVSVSGSAPAYVLNFGIPTGPAGSTGATGPAGSVGPAGPAGSTGPAGPAGATGATGPAGTAATIGVGTVTTGAAGSSVSITNVGTSSAAVFNFSIPRGDTGATGPQGPAGQGVPVGGATGTVLKKNSAADYDVSWQAEAGGRVIDVSDTTAGLRVTQRGTGAAIIVEDSTTPDTTAFYVNQNGDVGIKRNPTSGANEALHVGGNIHTDAIAFTNYLAGTTRPSNYSCIWKAGTELRYWDGGSMPNAGHALATQNWVFTQGYVTTSTLLSYSYITSGYPGISNVSASTQKKDFNQTPFANLAGGPSNSGNQYWFFASGQTGKILNFFGSSGGSYYYNDYGSYVDIYYNSDDDLQNIASNFNNLGISGLSFTFSDHSYYGPYYSSLPSGVAIDYPLVGISSGDRFISDLTNELHGSAITASATMDSVLHWTGGGITWGKPWTNEGYVTSAALNSYANLNVANSWGAKQAFPASTTTRASITIPHGTAPSSPVNGDVWTTTTGGLLVRINSATRTFVAREVPNSYTAGNKQTFVHNSSSAGMNVAPAASAPGTPVAGDVWHDSSTGILQIIGQSNSMRSAMTACRAFVNFNGTGTVAIRSGFNVSSITDNGVGDYTVNFTAALVDANYAVVGMGTDATDFTGIDVSLRGATTSYTPSTKTTSAARIGVARGANTVTDVADLSVVIFR